MTDEEILERLRKHYQTEIDNVNQDTMAEGPFAEAPLAALVLHINREVLHHGAEICLLRDLFLHS